MVARSIRWLGRGGSWESGWGKGVVHGVEKWQAGVDSKASQVHLKEVGEGCPSGGGGRRVQARAGGKQVLP